MNRVFLMIAAFTLAASGGCESVTLDALVGDPLTEAEKTRFVGTWVDSKSSDVSYVRLTEDGNLVLGQLVWSEVSQVFEAVAFPFEARKLGDTILLLYSDPDGYYLIRMAKFDRNAELRIYDPSPEKVRAAIEAKKLRGKIFTDDGGSAFFGGEFVRVEASSLIDAKLTNADLAALFLLDKACVLRRIQESNNREKAEQGNAADSR